MINEKQVDFMWDDPVSLIFPCPVLVVLRMRQGINLETSDEGSQRPTKPGGESSAAGSGSTAKGAAGDGQSTTTVSDEVEEETSGSDEADSALSAKLIDNMTRRDLRNLRFVVTGKVEQDDTDDADSEFAEKITVFKKIQNTGMYYV